jgi:iron complex outermembrane receptor protein
MNLPTLPASALAAACALACSLTTAQAQPVPDAVVVTGSARAQRVLDAPFAITAIDAATLRDAGPMVNLSEALVAVPGLVVNSRNNYAQDLQMSSRGFGARAAFGVRGLRLYTDGIPATMPDGQGQVAHFDIAGAQRIEVLRGPFSVLYGNSSGGVVAVFTAPVKTAQAELGLDAGSFGLRQARAAVATPLGNGFDLRASLSQFETDGFRPQSEARRRLANVRLGWTGASDTVTLLVNDHVQPAQDPLGLTPAQFNADWRQTVVFAGAGFDPATYVASNITTMRFDTRKDTRQTQVGVNWRHQFADGGVLRDSSLTAYQGKRSVVAWQAITPNTQAAATQAGGMVDFDRVYRGLDAKLGWQLGPVDGVVGVTAETQEDDRRGYENFTGTAAAPTALGVQGALRRDELNNADSREAYLQAQWPLSPALAITGGVRSGEVKLRTTDRYIKLPGNKDDSGALKFNYTNPVLGLRWTLAPGWALHASAARGFESPTLGELAYKAPTVVNGVAVTEGGFNTALKGQTSRQYEIGSKWQRSDLSAEAVVFQADTENEIGVLSNSGGRSVFQNVGRTRRKGLELAAGWQTPLPGLRLRASATWLQAEYLDSFDTCAVAGCPSVAQPRVKVDAGNRIAGTNRASAWAEAAWRAGPLGGEWALEWRAVAPTAANDTNTVFAEGYALAHLRWSGKLALGPADTLELLARVDNLFNRAHVGSVIVNEGNSRFFEPGTPRSVLLSARWQRRF